MKLHIQRSQRTTGFRGTPVFSIRAQAEISSEEQKLVSHYGLAKEMVYVSEQAQQHAVSASRSSGGVMRAIGHSIAARMSLAITVGDLVSGKSVEAKSLEEVIGIEEAIRSACENLKGYLEVAKSFDGRTEVVEF